MDYLEPRLKQFLPSDVPRYPLPWHSSDWNDQSCPHYSTEQYARYLLDALAGDERRSDLRRAYRFFTLHDTLFDKERVTAKWILIEATKRHMYVLPPARVESLRTTKTFKGI